MTNSPTTPTASPTIYRPHARYVLITTVAALSIPALIWLLLRGVDLAGDCEHGGAALYDVNGARLGTVTVDRGEDEEGGQ